MTFYEIALGFSGGDNLNFLQYYCGSYMLEAGITPHLALAEFEARDDREAQEIFSELTPKLYPVTLEFPSLSVQANEFAGRVIIDAILTRELDSLRSRAISELGPAGKINPPILIPFVVVGDRLSADDSLGYVRYMSRVFSKFTLTADRALLIRRGPYMELASLSLTSGATARITPGARGFEALRPGMTLSQVTQLLGQGIKLSHSKEGLNYDFIHLETEGVWLFFRPNGGDLYTIRFDEGFKGRILGICPGDKLGEIRRRLGEPDRMGAGGLYNTDTIWYYDRVIPGAVLRVDGYRKDDRSKVIFIC